MSNLSDLLQTAVANHQAGRLAEAEVLYRQILEQVPEDPDTLFLLGNLGLQTARPEAAAEWIGRAIAAAPDDAPAEFHYNLGLAYTGMGRAAEAAEHFRRAIALAPDFVESYSSLGNALKEQGKGEEADQCYRRALALCPSSAVAHHNLGVLLHEQGKIDDAIAHYRKAAELDPGDAVTYCSLADALRLSSRLEEAIAAYHEAIAQRPDLLDAHVGLGRALEEAGELNEAAQIYEEVLMREADSPEVSVLLGGVYRRLGRWQDAEQVYRSALRLAPDHASVLYGLGRLMEDRVALGEAEALYRRVLDLHPDNAGVHASLAQVLGHRGRGVAAEQAARRALALEPKFAPAHLALGNVLKDQGRLTEAEQAYRAALRICPDYAEVYSNLVALRRYSSTQNEDLQQILGLLRTGKLPETGAMHLHFAVGKILDDCEAYDDAFAHYHEGNRTRHKSSRFDAKRFADLAERVVDTFSPEFFATRSSYGSGSELPVFVVGMPRSGTSLAEQIIASHSQVHGAGELTKMHELALGLGARVGAGDSYPEAAAGLGADLARELAQEYEGILRQDADEGVVRISDKLPINFLHLGLIALFFPRARVIHCLRDPLDTCLSIYFQYFREGNDYAYDLADIGSYYRTYQRVITHWHRTLPLKMHELRYETLVADQAQTTKEVVAFLDLPWDATCLAFEHNPRPVQTASAWQVRQPVYRTAIGRWRNYEKYLDPLKHALGMADE